MIALVKSLQVELPPKSPVLQQKKVTYMPSHFQHKEHSTLLHINLHVVPRMHIAARPGVCHENPCTGRSVGNTPVFALSDSIKRGILDSGSHVILSHVP